MASGSKIGGVLNIGNVYYLLPKRKEENNTPKNCRYYDHLKTALILNGVTGPELEERLVKEVKKGGLRKTCDQSCPNYSIDKNKVVEEYGG